MSNGTLEPMEAERFTTLSHTITGCIAMLFNVLTLSYMWRLQADRSSSFTVQMCFICVIDVGSALVFVIRPLISVRDDSSGMACSCIFACVVIFDTVSKGNMFCICLQRYMFSRHLRTTVTSWRRIHTISMTCANVFLGVFVAVLFFPMLDATKGVYPMAFCNLETIRKEDGPNTFSLLFSLQILIILVSDILCLLTILKLKEAATLIQPSGVTPNIPSRDSSNTSGQGVLVRKTAHRRQQHAVMTILIILVVFNLSYIPITVVTLRLVFGEGIDPVSFGKGLAMLVTLMPCFVNSVLIATRTQDIRNMIKMDVRKLKSILLRPCRRL